MICDNEAVRRVIALREQEIAAIAEARARVAGIDAALEVLAGVAPSVATRMLLARAYLAAQTGER